MCTGTCDDCGKLFAGEAVDIQAAICPQCGSPLRLASHQEVESYLGNWRDRPAGVRPAEKEENEDEEDERVSSHRHSGSRAP